VDEASLFLLQASDMLRADPFSAAARKKLIEGSRGLYAIVFLHVKYRKTAILEVETDIIAIISVKPIVQAGIFVIMSVKILLVPILILTITCSTFITSYRQIGHFPFDVCH
jgi:hypothetical protein